MWIGLFGQRKRRFCEIGMSEKAGMKSSGQPSLLVTAGEMNQ